MAKVVRGGEVKSVKSRELVPGDITEVAGECGS